MRYNAYLYIAVMFGVSYLIRVLPFLVMRRPIKNKYIQSFLYYVPYVTLAVMTFPAILYATGSMSSAGIALAVAIVLAWTGRSLFTVAAASCITVLIVELIIL